MSSAHADLSADLEQLAPLIDAHPHAMVVAALDGCIVRMNSVACEVFGYEPHELLGQPVEALMPERFRANHRRLRDEFLADPRILVEVGRELTGLHKNGDEFPVEIGLNPWPAERPRYMLSAVVDMTGRVVTPQALHDREAVYQSLVESLPINVLRKSLDGELVYCNENYCRWLRKPLKDLLGQTDFDLFPRELAEKYVQDDARVIATGEAIEAIEEHTAHGETTFVEVHKSPIRDGRGQVIGVQGMFWDVSERVKAQRALEESQSRFKRLIDSDVLGFILATLDGQVLEANDLFLEMVGYTRKELESGALRWDQLTPPEYQPLDERAIEELQVTDRAPAWEKEYFCKGGGRIPVLVGVTMLEGSEDRCMCFVLDNSMQKRAEAQLLEAKEAADLANKAKSTFLASISHEIRTPLNAIVGMADLLAEANLGSTHKEYLEVLQSSADTLHALIADVLDFSRIEAGRLDLELAEFGLRDVLAGTVRPLAVEAHRKGVEVILEVQPDAPERIVGDPTRFRQVLLNLLGNAVKFTDRGEIDVAVRVEDDPQAAGAKLLHVSVCDTGIGISPEQQVAIFDPFVQTHTTSRRSGGTGLGLAISSRLTELMGGRLWYEPAQAGGSAFHATMDFRPAGEVEQFPGDLAAFEGSRVLVIDDNPAVRRSLEETLICWRMQPTVVGESAAARRVLSEAGRPFDLVLADAGLGDLDGFELIAGLINDALVSPQSIVMLLSAGNRSRDVLRCEEMGLAAYAMKPVNQSELFDTLAAVLSPDSAQPIAEQPPERDTRAFDLRILLAEDSPFNQKLALGVLSQRRHRVTVAETGREAVDAYRPGRFDLVLMDLQMPEMDGLEATRRIREIESGSQMHTPIVAMTAQALSGTRDACLHAGMDDYLTKPVRPRRLHELIDSMFEGAGEGSVEPASATSAQPELTELPGVDLDAALEYVGGDTALLIDVLHSFADELPQRLKRMRLAIAARDASVLKRESHTLVGNLRSLGAGEARLHAQSLEQAADAERFDAAAAELDSLDAAVAPMAGAIAACTAEASC